jgi:threonine dehydratase
VTRVDLDVDRSARAARTVDPVFRNSSQFVDEQLCAALGRRVICASSGNFGQAMADRDGDSADDAARAWSHASAGARLVADGEEPAIAEGAAIRRPQPRSLERMRALVPEVVTAQ